MSLLGTCLPAGTYCSTDDHARDRPDHHVPHGCRRQRVDGGPGDRGDREHEHRRGDRNSRWHSTPRHQLGRHNLGKAGADQPRDRPAECRERDARRAPAGRVDEPLAVGSVDNGGTALRVLLFEELALALAGFGLFRRVGVQQESAEHEQPDAEPAAQQRVWDVMCCERSDHDRRQRADQQPLRGRVVDDALFDVRPEPVAHPEHFSHQARADRLRGAEPDGQQEERAEKERARDAGRDGDHREQH